MTDHNLQHSIDELTTVQRGILKTQRQWWRGIFNGVMYGIGASVGVAVALTIAAAGLKQAEVIPIVGDWLAQLTPFVQSALHR